MAVSRERFGETKNGTPIYEYHLTNDNGAEVTVLNYGCIIRNIIVPAKDGRKIDVALGYDAPEEYFINSCFLGATVGPSANRIAKAKYSIDGKEYILPINDGPNNLHSDMNNGFHKRIWDAEEADNSVRFTLKAEDGDLGFPGNRVFEVTVSLSDDNALELHYRGTSDEKTLMNLTNHSYFNLSGCNYGSCLDHVLKLYSSAYTPVIDSEAIPTGEIASVEGTPFDFRQEKPIGRDIDADNEQLKFVGGYDHNFVVDGCDGTLRTFAEVSSPVTGITMKCSTTLPGFQLYTGNFLEHGNGKEGTVYRHRDGFCLETQFYPDSINKESFPDCVFGPDKVYDHVTVYQFS
ncbi:MAG: galactose mutarotase [Butyrivibrio sp.]|nr:galactose mutarotase [Butyrivibrio sp.]